jgi:hypothetical protein
MAEADRRKEEKSELRDPEFTSSPTPEGVSSRKFLGIPAWATAVGFAALAAIMYLIMLVL